MDFRQCMSFYRTMATRIQTSYRRRLHQQMKPSVIFLQATYRSRKRAQRFLLTNVYSVLLLRQLAASTITRLWRGFKGRKRTRRRKKYIARQQRAALKLQRAWAINQNFFATFVLTTSLKISSASDIDRWRRRRREVRWNATVMVQAYIRAMVARKKNKKWMAFMRRRNRHDALLWGAAKFKNACKLAATNAQRYWRGRCTRRENHVVMMSLVYRKGLREVSARVIQFSWMRSVKVWRKVWSLSRGGTLASRHTAATTCVGLVLNTVGASASTSSGNDEVGLSLSRGGRKRSSGSISAKVKVKVKVKVDVEEKEREEREDNNDEETNDEKAKKEILPELVSVSLFTHKMYTRRIRWKCTIEAADRGRLLPFVKDIQRVWRGHVGRSKTARARRRRRASMTIQNVLVRKRFARDARGQRQNFVNLEGCVLFMDEVCRGVALLNVMVYTPAARRIQNHLYRAWKSREPARHFAAATVVQCKWRLKAAKRERRRRRKGWNRRETNQYGTHRKLWSVFQAVERQTRDRLYHPSGDMFLKDDIDLGRWISRLGLRSLKNVLSRRGLKDLQSMYALCGFGGIVRFDKDLMSEMVEGYKEMGSEVSHSELAIISSMKNEINEEKKKLMNIKMDLAMLLPRKSRKNTSKSKKSQSVQLTWKQKTRKSELELLKAASEKIITDTSERVSLSEDVRYKRRQAALTSLESKIGMKGSHQSIVACERMLSMLEGDETTRSGFKILDTINGISTSYVKIMTSKLQKNIATTSEKENHSLTKRKSIILPPRGTIEIVGKALGVLCLQSDVHPSHYQLEAFLSQYDKSLSVDDIRTGKVNPVTMLPRFVFFLPLFFFFLFFK